MEGLLIVLRGKLAEIEIMQLCIVILNDLVELLLDLLVSFLEVVVVGWELLGELALDEVPFHFGEELVVVHDVEPVELGLSFVEGAEGLELQEVLIEPEGR